MYVVRLIGSYVATNLHSEDFIMNNLVKNKAFKPENNSIEICLLELEKYGAPHINKSSNGNYWWAGIAVFVTGKGVSFEVKYSNAKTPREAINGVYFRLIEAITKIKAT